MHASLGDFDNTKRDNHLQVHHRQYMQTIYGIYSQDRNGCYAHMDHVLAKSNQKLKLKAVL